MNKIAFFALMLALGLVGGCGNKKEEKKEEKDLARISQKQDKIEVKAAKVRLAPFEMELVSNGKVNARRKAVLAFITNDVVRKVHVKNGERVKKGSHRERGRTESRSAVGSRPPELGKSEAGIEGTADE